MNGVRVTKRVELTLDDSAWDAYTQSMPGTAEVAIILNRTIEKAYNQEPNPPRAVVEEAADKVMRQYASFGFHDTEPCWLLEQLLDYLYEEGRYERR